MTATFQQVMFLAEKHQLPAGVSFSYGTAGFRTRAEHLDSVMYRMGLLAVLRSKVKNAAIGVMITASHNPEEDNGVKLVDPMGEMLQASWEKYATTIANTGTSELVKVIEELRKSEGIRLEQPACVIIARDTRPSSFALSQAVKDGIEALEGNCKDYGLLSTPQLHYMVRCHNTGEAYGKPTEDGYYRKLSDAFLKLRTTLVPPSQSSYRPELFIDGANGIGALKVEQLAKYLNQTLKITICNDGSQGKLNHQCGADYVKLHQKLPEGLDPDSLDKCVSFDGDADRILYFYKSSSGEFVMLDGDKIATLFAGFIKLQLSQAGLCLSIGVVQTAYANGSSTTYIQQKLKVPVACVPTGVKHLHKKAEDFDIGIYFEANGHGTILFSEKAEDEIRKASKDESVSLDKRKAAETLASFIDLTNQTVGDVLSDMLLVETVLYASGWHLQDWNSSYRDLCNKQIKIRVKDQNVIKTADAERIVISPEGLQLKIDSLVTNYPSGRSFVRPSGTEDVVRVYAESDSEESATRLAYQVALEVYHFAQGLGEPPQIPN